MALSFSIYQVILVWNRWQKGAMAADGPGLKTDSSTIEKAITNATSIAVRASSPDSSLRSE
jgi:hypothetical protein